MGPPDDAHLAAAHSGIQRIATEHPPSGDQQMNRLPQIIIGAGSGGLAPSRIVVGHGSEITLRPPLQFNVNLLKP